MKWESGNLAGLFSILVGIYMMLLAKGVITHFPNDPERTELWRRKFGGIMMKIGPFSIGFGILQLLGVFR